MKITKAFPITISYGFGDAVQHRLTLVAKTYQSNNSLAIVAYDEHGDMFDVITVNLPFSDVMGDTAYIDTNNCPWATEFLKSNGIAKPMGKIGHSGFCAYPLYKFNMEMFKPIIRDIEAEKNV